MLNMTSNKEKIKEGECFENTVKVFSANVVLVINIKN